MKVVHVLESMGAGVLTSVSLSCNLLSSNGHDTYLIYSPTREETPENWQALFSPEVTTVRVDMCRDVSPIKDIKSAIMLYQAIRNIKPDIVHLHSSKAGILGRLASLLYFSKAKWFYSPRGLAYLNTELAAAKSKMYRIFEYLAAMFAQSVTLVGCSESEYNELIKIRSKNVILIENAVADIASLEMHKKNDSVIRIGTLGRLSTQKNPGLFAAIASSLKNKYSENTLIEFVWIGGGDKEFNDILLSSGVQVTGWLDKKNAILKLSKLDIYVQTSLYEGMPISVIEAMGMGIPVVVSNVIGNKDVVNHDVNGLICNNQKEFETAIGQLLESEEYRERLGTKAREIALQRFSGERLLRDLLNAYEEKLN